MILNASVRTDIPAFYSEWFMNRLYAGYALVRNPYNEHQVSHVSLTKEVVDCIVFCTKDPRPMFAHLQELDTMGYPYYFTMTLTPYDRSIECRVPDKQVLEEAFIALSKKIGKRRLSWRYDPILLNATYTIERHIWEFERMCAKFALYTDTVIISFIDIYANIQGLFTALKTNEVVTITKAFVAIAKRYGIEVQACGEHYDLTPYGVVATACIDQQRIEEIVGFPLAIKTTTARKHCHCLTSIDIGAYETCSHGCRYCYACHSTKKVFENYKKHDVNGELLIGTIQEEDTITKRKVESNKVTQLSFDF